MNTESPVVSYANRKPGRLLKSVLKAKTPNCKGNNQDRHPHSSLKTEKPFSLKMSLQCLYKMPNLPNCAGAPVLHSHPCATCSPQRDCSGLYLFIRYLPPHFTLACWWPGWASNTKPDRLTTLSVRGPQLQAGTKSS